MENKYEKSQNLSNTKFKRLIGVTRKTFSEMVIVLMVEFDLYKF